MIVRAEPPIVYPESDGEPIAQSDEQFEAISLVRWGLEDLFRDRDDVYIAADLFWYAVEGDSSARLAPDTMAVFGRPKRQRGSYLQWEEGGIAPQVVFEVLSPSNSFQLMTLRREWYEKYGVEEYYEIDTELQRLRGWQRRAGRLTLLSNEEMACWRSPRLGVTIEQRPGAFVIRRPDGRPLTTVSEEYEARRRAELEARRQAELAEAERERANHASAERDAIAAERDAAAAERDAAAAERNAERERAARLQEELDALRARFGTPGRGSDDS